MSASVPGGPHQSHIDLCEERLQFSANQLVLKRGQAVSLEPLVAGIEQREAHLVWLLWGVLQHPVPGDLLTVPLDPHTVCLDPCRHVVVLATPAPEHVGKPIQLPKLVRSESSGSSENCFVWQLVVKLVHSHRHMSRISGATVDVPIVLWNEVDVVEYDAVPVVIVHRLREADVEEHGSVEGVEISLVDEIDLVVEILLPEHRVEVPEEDGELGEAVPERHDQGNLYIA